MCARRVQRAWSGPGRVPGEEDALHHIEVLHEHVTLRLGAQVAHGVADAQLDGPLQGRGRGLRETQLHQDPWGPPLGCHGPRQDGEAPLGWRGQHPACGSAPNTHDLRGAPRQHPPSPSQTCWPRDHHSARITTWPGSGLTEVPTPL